MMSVVTGEIWPLTQLARLAMRDLFLAGAGAVRYVTVDEVLWADLPDRRRIMPGRALQQPADHLGWVSGFHQGTPFLSLTCVPY